MGDTAPTIGRAKNSARPERCYLFGRIAPVLSRSLGMGSPSDMVGRGRWHSR